MSLVPSTTDTVFRLGAGDRVAGVTRYCVRPAEARERAKVIGGTKKIRIEETLALEPDLVLANQEENTRSDIEQLLETVPVFVFYPRNVADAVRDIRVLGALLHRTTAAESIAANIESSAASIERGRTYRYLYLIWQNPIMVAGRGTFVDALLELGGGANAATSDDRYPAMTHAEIRDAAPDVLLLSSEPFPFEDEHARSLREVTGIPTRCVDGQRLSWHGARLLEGVPYVGEIASAIARDRVR